MLKAIIVEDEKRARDLLVNTIAHYKLPVEVMANCATVLEAIKQIQLHKPDFIFLDIEMPNYSGFELLDFFDNIDFEIIFLTAYSKYAVKAFQVSAVDYLLKPLQIDRLESALNKVKEKLALKNSAHRVNALKENLQSDQLTKIVLPLANSYQFIEIGDIVAIEAARAYCNFHLKDKRKFLVSKSLRHFEEILNQQPGFVRIHRSFLVNLNYIERYFKNEQRVELINNLSVKVSRDRKEYFEQIFNKT